MIGPPGAQIWMAAGVTDLRRGFTGLSAALQTVLEQDLSAATYLYFVAGVVTSLNCCGGMAMVCVCFRSG